MTNIIVGNLYQKKVSYTLIINVKYRIEKRVDNREGRFLGGETLDMYSDVPKEI